MEQKVAIGHYPILVSIFEAKKRGLSIFNLGKIGPNFPSKKEEDIALFKKGFSTNIRSKQHLILKNS